MNASLSWQVGRVKITRIVEMDLPVPAAAIPQATPASSAPISPPLPPATSSATALRSGLRSEGEAKHRVPISGQGWELVVERLGIHRYGELSRTYGRYAVTIEGVPQQSLTGFMVEAAGPGDNSAPDNGRRIAAGRYDLTTHFRAFVSAGYSASTTIVADPPMPAIRLLGTGKRTGILIHPVYPPAAKLYLASVGCLNPSGPIAADAGVDFWDSHRRVIALLDSLRAFAPAAFTENAPTSIAGAAAIVDGEPEG